MNDTSIALMERELLQNGLKQLRLRNWSEWIDKDLNNLIPEQQQLILNHLTKWVKADIIERKNTLIASRIKSARFKKIQTIDGFDFTYNKTTQNMHKLYLNLYNSIGSQELPSAVFTGNAGLGKTHLARALGYRACQHGISVLFATTSEIVNQLIHAQKTFHLEVELNRYRRPQVLIIDELGYVSLESQASNLFFQVISARHDQGLGTITTTNLPFGKFNQIFANDAIALAIVDRLVSEAEVFFMEGTSYREYQRKQKLNAKHKD